MQLGMMRRLMKVGHQCVVFDLNSQSVQALATEGAKGAQALDDFVKQLSKPRGLEQIFAGEGAVAMRYKFGGHVERPTGG
jgi:6-phosphogluconate dehydrogenase (decarboxylating)